MSMMKSWMAGAGAVVCTVVCTIVCASLVAVVPVTAQEKASKAAAKSTLTPMDYVEIQQLISLYPYALDTGADHGHMYSDLFTPDGNFGKFKGRDELAALAYQHKKGQGPAYARQFVTNIIIDPSPDGAVGKAYMAAIEFGEGGKAGVVEAGGHYEDVYVKTAAGWRFKSRAFIASKAGPQPPAPAATQTQSR